MPDGKRGIGDREAAALLAGRALVEIRYLASTGSDLERIRFLADLAHNLPGIALRGGDGMEWVWSTAGPEGRAWILETLKEEERVWTPPAPAPRPAPGPGRSSGRRRAALLTGRWPVRTPRGSTPLPPAARVLKAVSTAELIAVHEEAGRLQLGLGTGGPWFKAHIHPDSTHYLVPDPAPYYWPDPGEMIQWWHCRELVRMADGQQVSGSVAVLPERFAALPDTLPRREQRRLVHLIRATRYDRYLWGRDHKIDCTPERCGYDPDG